MFAKIYITHKGSNQSGKPAPLRMPRLRGATPRRGYPLLDFSDFTEGEHDVRRLILGDQCEPGIRINPESAIGGGNLT